jgi:hypothetical protein
MWLRMRRDIEVIAVTPVSVDGARDALIQRVGPGQERAVMVDLPAGTQAVRIERVQRQRIDLGQLRSSPPGPPRRARPSWQDDSWLWLWWHTWRTENTTRRAYRRNQPR